MKGNRLFTLFILLFFGAPLLVLVLYSAAPWWRFPDIIPHRFTFSSFDFLISQKNEIGISVLSSLLYSFTTVIAAFIISVLPAQVFARREFRGRVFLETILIAPALLPSISFAMGAHYIFLKSGIADSFAGVVIILTTVSYPYMLRALTAGFITYGEEYALCARNLGAGPFTILFRVELPLLLPSIISGGTIVFLVSFSEYFLIFLIGGGIVPSYSGYIFPYLGSSEHSTASILTLIFIAIPFLLFLGIDIFLKLYFNRRHMQV